MKKSRIILGFALVSIFVCNAASFADTNIPSTQEVIKALGLQPMSDEACPGYFLETYKSSVKAQHSKDRSAGSLIYYLMTDEVRVDPWHRISSDEIMLYHVGAPMSMLLLYPDGTSKEVVLGPDVLAGQVQQFLIPAEVWMGFAKQDHPNYNWGLYGVMVVPGWHIEDIEFTTKGTKMSKELMKKYPAAVSRGKELGLFLNLLCPSFCFPWIICCNAADRPFPPVCQGLRCAEVAGLRRRNSRAQLGQKSLLCNEPILRRLHMVIRKAMNRVALSVLAIVAVLSAFPAQAQESPIMDSDMSFAEAVSNMPLEAPKEILESLELTTVRYFSFDGKLHQGQILVHRDLVKDVQNFFRLAREHHFPIHSVIPISSPAFCWSDDKSMEANNSSGFNYRFITGKKVLSKHAHGRAIDINPRQNPYVRGSVTLPAGAVYEPGNPGVFTDKSPLVIYLKKQGWVWGGDWESLKDNHHFQK